MGFFPVDDQTLRYLRQTGRTKDEVDLVERYTKEQGLFRTDSAPVPTFTKVVRLDLSTVEPCLAGPKRPQDRIALSDMKPAWRKALTAVYGKQPPVNGSPEGRWEGEGGHKIEPKHAAHPTPAAPDPGFSGVPVKWNGKDFDIKHGDVVIAAITSCTNTSNPSVMVAAGLLAKKAVEKGLTVPPHVKTSLAPGSRVVTDYFDKAGLDKYLEKVGFYTVGYGCTTCIGNSGPLPEPISERGQEERPRRRRRPLRQSQLRRPHQSGCEGQLPGQPAAGRRLRPGRHDRHRLREGADRRRQERLARLSARHLADARRSARRSSTSACCPRCSRTNTAAFGTRTRSGTRSRPAKASSTTGTRRAPTFKSRRSWSTCASEPGPIQPIRGARCLAALGDSVTTDHISPAGSIAKDSPAGKYLMAAGVEPRDFNSYGARRGNDRVMTRGTFANIRIRNLLAPGTEGGVTRHLPDGDADVDLRRGDEIQSRRRAARSSWPAPNTAPARSRDWAAKGPFLLGVRAVIAASFERIHRSNLVGDGRPAAGVSARRHLAIARPDGRRNLRHPRPRRPTSSRGKRSTSPPPPSGGTPKVFPMTVRIDTPVELDYYRNGGILQTVLRKLLKS